MSPHISIKGEVIFSIFGIGITNTILTTVLMLVFFSFIAKYFSDQSHKKDKSLLFYGMRSLVKVVYDLIYSVLQSRTNYFFPILGSFFFFILLMNWSGLIPGSGSILIKPQYSSHTVAKDMINEISHSEPTEEESHVTATLHKPSMIPLFRGGTADLNTTIALALITVGMTQYFGFTFLGPKKHLGKYFNLKKDPMLIFLGPLEILLEFARVMSFSFRLYGNIFAGEVLLTVIVFLVPIFLGFIVTPMYFMEIFVGIVQALVFVMLSSVFINMAIAEHH